MDKNTTTKHQEGGMINTLVAFFILLSHCSY